MMLFDLNNDILIKIQEEVAIKRKHKLFLDNLKKHRDRFYNDFDMDQLEDKLEDNLKFRDGYWYQKNYYKTDQCRGNGKWKVEWDDLRYGGHEFFNWGLGITYPPLDPFDSDSD